MKVLVAASLVMILSAAVWAQEEMPIQATAANELDAFVQTVLQHRNVGWDALGRFIFNEAEELTVSESGSGDVISRRTARYRWFVRDGELVRSPLSVNGIELNDAQRIAAEDLWRTGGRGAKKRSDITRDGFFNFSFEPGRYLLAGRETEAGRPILVIEYYPKQHFSTHGRDPVASKGDRFDPLFDRTSKVTMRVDAEEREIARIEFDNDSMDYLPFSWAVDFAAFHASMTMQRLPDGAWVPRSQEVDAVLETAEQTLRVSLRRQFSDYARQGVRVKFSTGDRARQP